MKESFWKRYKIQDRIIWIFLVFLLWYLFIGDGIIALPFYYLFKVVDVSDAMRFVLSMYTITIGGAISYFLLCLLKKNRGDVLHSVLPRKGSGYMLLMGLLLGFLMNFACILCALLHGDIKLHYDFTASGIPLMVFAFISVFIQSSTEEMWTRGFMYERINVHYPLWVAIVVNGTIFGLLHLMNPGSPSLRWRISSSADWHSRYFAGTQVAFGHASVFIPCGTSHRISYSDCRTAGLYPRLLSLRWMR